MVVEAVQNYVNLVNGLTRATRTRARSTARSLLATAGLEEAANGAGERVTRLAEEMLTASRANRELLENLVAAEVTKAATRLGFVRSDDLDEVREEIAELRVQLERSRREAATAEDSAGSAAPATTPVGPVGTTPVANDTTSDDAAPEVGAGAPAVVPDPDADAGA